MPVVIGGDNLPSPVGIGLTDLPNIANIGGAMAPLAPPVPASLGIMRGAGLCEFPQVYIQKRKIALVETSLKESNNFWIIWKFLP